jgi:hypothetical protein
MNIHVTISEDMPEDLMIKLKLKKLEPFPLDVPCLNGLGSWYKHIVNFKPNLRTFFRDSVQNGEVVIIQYRYNIDELHIFRTF